MNIQRSGPRVLLLNNYEMDEAYDEWKAGLCPSHHLWGAADLGVHGIDLKILPFEKFRALNRYWRAQRLLGLQSTGMIALDQQIRCLVDTKSEVIYSACQYHSFLLARLRRLGILRKPLIATLHHPFAPGGKEEQLLRGHDLLLCLSSKVRQQALDRGAVDQHKIRIIEWGPDLDFFGPFRPYDSMHIGNIPLLIGAGKSARDYDTVVEAEPSSVAGTITP